MAIAKTDTYLGERYRRIARRRGKVKAIVAVARTLCEIAWMIICDPTVRFTELGPDYYARRDAAARPAARSARSNGSTPASKSPSPPPPDPATPVTAH
ncbi:MAG: hypothetical protein ACRDOK_18260 [Streptosporangiaceae bacterium]